MTEPANSPGSAPGRPASSTGVRRVLVVSAVFPSSANPNYGVFVKQRVRAVADLPGTEVRVVSPTPLVPPIGSLRRRYEWWKFPTRESVDGLDVVRPRYALPPKVGGYFHPELMYLPTLRAVRRIRETFPFDLIDAHFVYPSGVLAEKLGRRFRVPVVVTGRGEDMCRFPALPVVGDKIRRTLRSGVSCIGVSREIASEFVRNGAAPDRVSCIPNGVDCERFRPVPREDARQKLQIPRSARLIVAVGNIQELKGFHLLVEALPSVRSRFPETLLVVIGSPAPYGRDFTEVIDASVRDLGLAGHVRVIGRRPHDELTYWYSAADVFALLSSREGSPNVLLEALACGTPAVSTAVGGAADELADPRLGILLPERSAAAAADALTEALARPWDRRHIADSLRDRSWAAVARRVSEVFDGSLAAHRAAGATSPRS